MYLNQTVEYGLRAMAQLAVAPNRNRISAEELACLTGIPRHYVSKIMRRLVEAGLVTSLKGHQPVSDLRDKTFSFSLLLFRIVPATLNLPGRRN